MNGPTITLDLDQLYDDVIAFGSLLQVLEQEWRQQGCWSEYDQSVMNRLEALGRRCYEESQKK